MHLLLTLLENIQVTVHIQVITKKPVYTMCKCLLVAMVTFCILNFIEAQNGVLKHQHYFVSCLQWFQVLKPPRKLSSEVKKTCVLANQCQMRCLVLNVPVSVLDPSLPLKVRRREIPLRLALQHPIPQLAHSHTSK